MHFRCLALRGIGTLALMVMANPLSAQSAPPPKLMGTWVMDTTNGPDDHGLPKSETLVFAPAPNGFRLTATTDDGQGPGTSTFTCATGGATTDAGGGQSLHCTLRITADSVLYALDLLKGGKTIPTERGRLIVAASGTMLRDQFDALSESGAPTHHRHIYAKQP